MTQKIGLIQSCERISRQDFEDFRGAERGAERGGRVNATLLAKFCTPVTMLLLSENKPEAWFRCHL